MAKMQPAIISHCDRLWKQVEQGESSGELNAMLVMPVIDILNGQVVHAIAGKRPEYRPITSALCTTSHPVDIAAALATEFGSQQAYVADLDALQGEPIQWPAIRQIANHLPQLWLDVGITCRSDAREVLSTGRHYQLDARWIVATESLLDPNDLPAIASLTATNQFILSLDLRCGEPVVRCTAWQSKTALEIATEAIRSGYNTILILDIAQVGMNSGVGTLPLCRKIRDEFPQVSIATGGGIRDAHDLLAVGNAGADIALVSSALHARRLDCEAVSAIRHSKQTNTHLSK
ncbi:MAG: HisA/HisF-related TIM barrel protein [Planctomycetota bacterium]|nr:HisA/HisF-related TIM barrel protein [Planctomycetota bacterium]MDA1180121.1 HisA/HisF-related TIM barrel protein [Planctomycetota bacterium]